MLSGSMDKSRRRASRQALEALRNGVPNQEAVKILGCNQPATGRFGELLSGVADQGDPPRGALGMLISGDFGAGKSHLLTYLEQMALSQGFVCSKVAISKETPLFDLGKVFKSAMENGRMPDRSGRMIEEIAQRLKPGSRRYGDFYKWVHDPDASGLNPMFAASLTVHEGVNDFELLRAIEYWWGGDKIRVVRIRDGLRQIGRIKDYRFRVPKLADLPRQRLRFAVELIKAAGYRGWVVLLDEIELVGSYSILQRSRSYAELSRWMGRMAGEQHPGLVTVGAVTDDFASEIIHPDGAKKDRDYVGAKLEANDRYRRLAPAATEGMGLLERSCLPLRSPTEEDVQETTRKLRRIYRDAYGWEPPRLEVHAGGAGIEGRMRYKVRSSINTWDLLRLVPDARPEIQVEEFRHTYEEDTALERESKDSPDALLEAGRGVRQRSSARG